MAIQDEIRRKNKPKKVVEVSSFGKKNKKKSPILPKRGDSARTIARKLLYLGAVAVLIISLVILFLYYKQEFDATKLDSEMKSLSSSLAEKFPTASVVTTPTDDKTPLPLLPLAEELLKQNPETVGWIKLENTLVDYPIVQKKDPAEGNSYYLTHNFKNETNRVGAIFADSRATISDRQQSKNLVLYGHDEASNKMFGDLDKFKGKTGNAWNGTALDFYKQNPTFTFSTNYTVQEYKIFAMFVIAINPEQDKNEPIFDYINYINFDSEKYSYENFMENVTKRNKLLTDIDVVEGDNFVTLSTCSSEFDPSRFVVIGRRIREGEDPDVNTENVSFNHEALEPDWDTIYGR